MDKKDIFVIIVTAIIVMGIGGYFDGEAYHGFLARTLTKNNLDTCDICSSSTDYCKSRPACSGCSCYN
jgi:hypothetical protein